MKAPTLSTGSRQRANTTRNPKPVKQNPQTSKPQSNRVSDSPGGDNIRFPSIVNPRKLEHGFRMISAGIPYTFPQGQEEHDVPNF